MEAYAPSIFHFLAPSIMGSLIFAIVLPLLIRAAEKSSLMSWESEEKTALVHDLTLHLQGFQTLKRLEIEHLLGLDR